MSGTWRRHSPDAMLSELPDPKGAERGHRPRVRDEEAVAHEKTALVKTGWNADGWQSEVVCEHRIFYPMARHCAPLLGRCVYPSSLPGPEVLIRNLVAGDELLRLDEGPVDERAWLSGMLDAPTLGVGLEPGGIEPRAGSRQLFVGPRHGADELLPRHRAGFQVLGGIDQDQESHPRHLLVVSELEAGVRWVETGTKPSSSTGGIGYRRPMIVRRGATSSGDPSLRQLGQAPLEEPPLRRMAGEGKGAPVGDPGVRPTAEPPA